MKQANVDDEGCFRANMEKYFPVDGNIDIIRCTKAIDFKTILDVGFGKGGASAYFAMQGKSVTALGKKTAAFNYPKGIFERYSVQVFESWIDDFEPLHLFDAIWASHVLEHTVNISHSLLKLRSFLRNDGWLFICLPPHKCDVVPGHISVGWSVVQLMYNLYFNGFNIKDGHFVSHKYNIAAFVRKTDLPFSTPSVAGILDFADINDDFPIELQKATYGQIESVNWFFKPIHKPLVVPAQQYLRMVGLLCTTCNILIKTGELAGAQDLINKAIDIDPTNPILFKKLGYILKTSGDLEGSKKALEKSIAFDSLDPDPHIQLCHIYKQLGDTDHAIQKVQDAIDLKGDNIYYSYLGDLLEKKGDLEGAKEAREKAHILAR